MDAQALKPVNKIVKRIPSLNYSSFQARTVLRARSAALPSLHHPRGGLVSSEQEAPRDMDVLQLLLDTTFSRNDDETSARQEYARIRSGAGAELPDFDEALARGWFRIIQGRVVRASALPSFYLHREIPYEEPLCTFVHWLDEVAYHIAHSGTHASADAFEEYLAAGGTSGNRPPVLSPGWIAARLWDGSLTVDLQAWTMRWELLDWVPLVPCIVWSGQDAQRFRDAALHILRHANLPTWDQASLADGLQASGDMREVEPTELKPDLLGRVLDHRRYQYGSLYKQHALCALMRVLTLELAHIEYGPVPSAVAQELAVLAMRHPDLCNVLVDCCLQQPQVMADLVFCPETASLVCYLVATWHMQFKGDREYRNEAIDSVQASLLADFLEVLQHHLFQGESSAVEYARLLIVIQEHDCSGREGLPLLSIGLDHLRGLPVEIKREVRKALVQAASIRTDTPEFAVMLKVAAVIGESFSRAEADSVALNYWQAFHQEERPDMRWVDAAGAAVLAQLAMDHGDLRPKIFCPLNLKDELVRSSSSTVNLGLAIREQIRVMSRAVAGYPETVPDELVAALASAIQSGACDRAEKHRVDAFTFQLDSNGVRRHGPRLEYDLIEAMNRLAAPAQQERLLKALLLVEDTLIPALLLPRVPAVHRESIAARLKTLTPTEASSPAFVTQGAERVQALLDAGFPDMANAYLQDAEEELRGKRLPELTLQTLNLELQIHYLSGAFNLIASAKVPDGLRPEHHAAAQRTLDFFRALVLLKKKPPEAQKAAAIFNSLYCQHSLPAYAINLLAARRTMLLGENIFRIVEGEHIVRARFAIEDADRAIPSLGALSDISRSIHVPNCAAMLLAVGQPREAMNRLKELAPLERTAESISFEAVASARLGEHDRARALIRSGKERYIDAQILVAAESHIDHSAGFGALPHVLAKQETASQLRSAMRLFMELPVTEQAEVLMEPPLALEKLLTAAFQDALASFQRTLSFLKLDRNKFHEDDFNGIVAALVEARLEGTLGWQAHEQSPGGFTGKGNPGERDLVIRRRGTDVSVFEALKSASPTDKEIAVHFWKLFAYTAADILFHVTYSFCADVSKMLATVKRVAEQPPAGILYLNLSDIPADGARPAAWRGAYRRDGRDTTVIFFVIDMCQVDQRAAVGAPDVSILSSDGAMGRWGDD